MRGLKQQMSHLENKLYFWTWQIYRGLDLSDRIADYGPGVNSQGAVNIVKLVFLLFLGMTPTLVKRL